VTGNVVSTLNNETLDWGFEARIFNSNYELRWLNQSNGEGIAVLLSEQGIESYFKKSVDLDAIKAQEQAYFLWGEGYKAILKPGWSRLTTARLGKLDIPVGGVNQSKQRVKLITKEYFQCLAELHGNVIVAEERLMDLQLVLGKA